MHLIWVSRKQKYFCKRGLTRLRKIRSDLPVRQNQPVCAHGSRKCIISMSSPPSAQLRTGAGTHTPRPRFLARWLTPTAPTDEGGYGSVRGDDVLYGAFPPQSEGGRRNSPLSCR